MSQPNDTPGLPVRQREREGFPPEPLPLRGEPPQGKWHQATASAEGEAKRYPKGVADWRPRHQDERSDVLVRGCLPLKAN